MRTCLTRLTLAAMFILSLVVHRSARSGVDIGGYAMVGGMQLRRERELRRDSRHARAARSSAAAPTVGLPWGGLFVDIGAWRYSDEGERVFVLDGRGVPARHPA